MEKDIFFPTIFYIDFISFKQTDSADNVIRMIQERSHDTSNHFLTALARGEKRKICLYRDERLAVECGDVEALSRGVMSPDGDGVEFEVPPESIVMNTINELCLLSERGVETEMNLEGAISDGSYSGSCVSAASTVKPMMMSFTVFLTGSVNAVTETVITTCSSSDNCTDSLVPLCGDGSRLTTSCPRDDSEPDGLYDSSCDSMVPMTGKYDSDYFSYRSDVGCVCMLNGWTSAGNDICANTCKYFQFKLKSNGCSEAELAPPSCYCFETGRGVLIQHRPATIHFLSKHRRRRDIQCVRC